jgi:hypothetical protein
VAIDSIHDHAVYSVFLDIYPKSMHLLPPMVVRLQLSNDAQIGQGMMSSNGEKKLLFNLSFNAVPMTLPA